MAIGFKIDFEKTIGFTEISEDLRIAAFPTAIISGDTLALKIEISNEAHELLPNVYNLAFGPMDKRVRLMTEPNCHTGIIHGFFQRFYYMP